MTKRYLVGSNIHVISGTKAYVEQRADGGVGFQLDRGNYVVMKKGEISAYWNDNNGHGGSKRIIWLIELIKALF